MGWFKKKPSWDRAYAERIYDAYVSSGGLGSMTPEKLHIPRAAHRQYNDKLLMQLESLSFMALSSAANRNTAPELLPVMVAFGHLLAEKRSARGIKVDVDDLAESCMVDVTDLIKNPFPWAQRWLAEFRNNPQDNYMVGLFADYNIRQYHAIKDAIETTPEINDALVRR